MKLKKSKNIFLSELENFEPKTTTFRNLIIINELSNRKYSKKINKNLLGLSNNNSIKVNNKKKKNIKRPLTTTSSSNKNRYKKNKITNKFSSNFSSFLSQSKDINTNRNIEQNTNKRINTISNPFLHKTNDKIKKKLLNNRPFTGIKYPFIIDNHPILPTQFTGLPKEIIIENKKLCESLKKDNNKLFDNSFCLIPKKNFTPKFRYPFQEKIIIKSENDILKELGIKKEEEEKEEFKAFKALTVLNLARNTIIKKEKEKYSKEEILSRMKQCIIKAAFHFKRLSITLNDLYTKYPIKNSKNYDYYFDQLIKSIKINDLEKANSILDDYKFLVLHYDIFKQTPLHWVSKRNIYQLISKIVSYGADVDSLDQVGYSSLHLAIINNNFESVVFLFLNYASPFIKDKYGKKPIEYCKNYKMEILCKKATGFHLAHLFGNNKNFYQNVKRSFTFFVESEFRNDLGDEAYKFIYELADNFRKQQIIQKEE